LFGTTLAYGNSVVEKLIKEAVIKEVFICVQ
jgi:hypothetical protein